MLPSLVTSSVVYASLFGLMALGLTLTYITTKVPNFAYGSFVGIGIYTAYSLFKIEKINPYFSTFLSFLFAASASLLMYLAVIRPLSRKGSSIVSLMIATFGVDIGFVGIIGIYTDYITVRYKLGDATSFYPLLADFSLYGIPGVVIISPIMLFAISVGLYILLTHTKFGTAMRATVENPSLAKVLGINVEIVYMFSWLLAGGLAGVAGSLYTLWLPGGRSTGSDLIVEIFASSVLGGINSIFGAVLGGLIIGVSEISLTNYMAQGFGFIPLIVVFCAVLATSAYFSVKARGKRRVAGIILSSLSLLMIIDLVFSLQYAQSITAQTASSGADILSLFALSFVQFGQGLIYGFGPDAIAYQKGIPLMIMVFVLLFLPKGLASLNLRKLVKGAKR